MHVVRLCVSNWGTMRTINDGNIDGNKEGEDVNEVSNEREELDDEREGKGEEDDDNFP